MYAISAAEVSSVLRCARLHLFPFHCNLLAMMKRFRHWTPDYVLNRLAVRSFQRSRPDTMPLFAVGAVQFLEGYLAKTDRVFEYGCGFSTVWLAKRTASVVSVDDDPIWYDRIKPLLPENATLLLASSGKEHGRIADRSDYIDAIKAYERTSFDLVIIDGQARAFTAVAALDYIKNGGILCWDDVNPRSERDAREPIVCEFLHAVKDWRRVFFDDGTHLTALYFKPSSALPHTIERRRDDVDLHRIIDRDHRADRV